MSGCQSRRFFPAISAVQLAMTFAGGGVEGGMHPNTQDRAIRYRKKDRSIIHDPCWSKANG